MKTATTRTRKNRPSTTPAQGTSSTTSTDALAAQITDEGAALSLDLSEMALDTDSGVLALSSLHVKSPDLNAVGSGLRSAMRALAEIIAQALDLTDGAPAVAGCASRNVAEAGALLGRAAATLAKVYAYDLAVAAGEAE